MSNKDFPKLSFKQGKRINLNYAIRSWFDKIGVEVLGHFIPEEKVKMVDSIKWTADLIEQNGKSVQIAERFRNHPYQFYVQDQEGLSNYCAVVPDKSAFFDEPEANALITRRRFEFEFRLILSGRFYGEEER